MHEFSCLAPVLSVVLVLKIVLGPRLGDRIGITIVQLNCLQEERRLDADTTMKRKEGSSLAVKLVMCNTQTKE